MIPLWINSERKNHIEWKLCLSETEIPPNDFILARSLVGAQGLVRRFGCPIIVIYDYLLGSEFLEWLKTYDDTYKIIPENFKAIRI